MNLKQQRKELSDIAWNVTEEEYRADPALSYSTLARYEREGFNNLNKLFDKLETPSLTFGSCVDTLITGSEEEFNELFTVVNTVINLSDTLVTIIKKLFADYSETYHTLREIPDGGILASISDIQWNNHWLPRTRVKKIKEDGEEYYNLLYSAGKKKIIDIHTYNDVLSTVGALRSASSTKFYFEPNDVSDNNIERFYQLKFKASFNGVNYRCMMDECIVIHDRKLIIPVDLKTSSHTEWDFYKSFIEWNYMIQARLYYRILKANIEKDPYFKDFTIAPYKFIVANKRTLTPLVWNYEDTFKDGTLYYGKQENIICRDPFTIGEELYEYLTTIPKVPKEIDLVKPNSLCRFLDNL